jgi:hypothetical protein
LRKAGSRDMAVVLGDTLNNLPGRGVCKFDFETSWGFRYRGFSK